MSQTTTTAPTTTAVTPAPTSVRGPSQLRGREGRSWRTLWEIDESKGAELVVRRSEDGDYRASFRAVTFTRTTAGQVAFVRFTPAAAVGWTIETTPRYCAKRLCEINEQATATLAQRLAASAPDLAEVLARATRAGALGAMNTAAARLRATFPDLDETRCASEAVAGWTCLATTYPSGNPRTHAYHHDQDGRWEVSSFPDAEHAAPHHQDCDVSNLAAAVVAHYRRTL